MTNRRKSKASRTKAAERTPVLRAVETAHDMSEITPPEELEGPVKVLVEGVYLKPKTYGMHESRVPLAIAAAKRMWYEEHGKGVGSAIKGVHVLEAPPQDPVSLMKSDVKKMSGMGKANWRMFSGRKNREEQDASSAEPS